MNQNFSKIFHVTALMAFFTAGSQGAPAQSLAAIDSSQSTAFIEKTSDHSTEGLSALVLGYSNAMAAGRVKEWALLDLGCIHRNQQLDASSEPDAESSAEACWEATMTAHRKMVADETEPGIFGALGRGTGFGLIHVSHQHADFWKDYPPALAVSPTVVREDSTAPIPDLQIKMVQEPQWAGLVVENGKEPAKIQKISVDIVVTYPDPLTAPLALLPEEPWWASPVIRRYGPVRNLVTRFTIARGLRALGYPIDQAVINEALPGTPQVAGPSAPGIVPSSPIWWDWNQAQQYFEEGIQEVRQMDSFVDRVRKFQRLLLLDPKEPRVNAMYGMDLYQAFLREGLAKGQIESKNEDIGQKLGELYWNIQAQTWRQEFTEVAAGHSFAADVFYQTMPALKTAIQGGQGHEEMRRRLGAIYRWNNDVESALTIHEQLLKNVPSHDNTRLAQILSDIAWDRVQWLSWERRYDHPWMTQARKEAEQSLHLASAPIDKVVAGEALLILDALAVPRDQPRLREHVELVRTWHDQLTNVEGTWSHLVGNDLVKSLIPEGLLVKLPDPVRSSEVMPREVHSRIQDRNFFKTWNFDQDIVGALPSEFSTGSSQEGPKGEWRIEMDSQAPSPPHVITQAGPCTEDTCFQVLLRDQNTHELPDIVVFIRPLHTGGQGEAGIALAAKDVRNFYAVTLNATGTELSIYRVQNGRPNLLGQGAVNPKAGPWHVLRVQMVNSAHVDHPLLEIYVDGHETKVMASEPIKGSGHIGLVTKGDMVAKFDRLGVIEMITSRPMSKPAAY